MLYNARFAHLWFQVTLSEFDKSSTSTVFKSQFNEVRQKYLDFCHIYTDGSKVETKVASAYVCPYGTRVINWEMVAVLLLQK